MLQIHAHAAPSISGVANASSFIGAGLPNSGITPSTLFAITGSLLADLSATAILQDSSAGLPTKLNGASVSVTVAGTTLAAPIYYATVTAIAAVLPAATPLGAGKLTVTYNGVPSAPFDINVVPHAYGIDTYNGNMAVVTDAVTGALITWTAPAKPGQVLIAWGTGLGADPEDSDTTSTSTPHSIAGAVEVYLGSSKASNVLYAGASIYPGVHVVGFQVPDDAPTGCFVPLAIVTGQNIVSNTPLLPISPGPGPGTSPCTDAMTGLNGTQLAAIPSGASRVGVLAVDQSTGPGAAESAFLSAVYQRAPLTTALVNPSAGGCVLNQAFQNGVPPKSGLESDSIIVAFPNGSGTVLAHTPTARGLYFAFFGGTRLPNGAYQFSATSNGSDVGMFTTNVAFPALGLEWLNPDAAATVDRIQGLDILWTGAPSGTFVVIRSNALTCIARAEDGRFTVPPHILAGLRSGSAQIAVFNTTSYGSFAAPGLDAGFTIGMVSISVNATLK